MSRCLFGVKCHRIHPHDRETYQQKMWDALAIPTVAKPSQEKEKVSVSFFLINVWTNTDTGLEGAQGARCDSASIDITSDVRREQGTTRQTGHRTHLLGGRMGHRWIMDGGLQG